MEQTMSKPVKVQPLEAHLGYWLRFVSNHVSHAFGLRLAARDVTAAEWVVMRELFEHESVVPSALAARIGLTRGAISKLTDRLVAKALVTRTADGEDRRYQTLALTAKGRTLTPALSDLADQNDEEFFGHLDRVQRDRLEGAMKEIVRRHGLRSIPID
jgi:DNA-binding MarR family transcriptional regulator